MNLDLKVLNNVNIHEDIPGVGWGDIVLQNLVTAHPGIGFALSC